MRIDPADRAALENAERVVSIANAVMTATHHDALRSACALVTIAQVLAGTSPAQRTALAWVMRDAVADLDADVLDASLQ